MFAWLSVCSDILVRSNTKSTWEWEAVVHFWPSWNASSSEFAFPRASKFFFEQILTANCQHRVLFVIHPDKDHFFVVCGVFHTETQLWKRFSLKCCFDCFFSFSLVNRGMERIQFDVSSDLTLRGESALWPTFLGDMSSVYRGSQLSHFICIFLVSVMCFFYFLKAGVQNPQIDLVMKL